MFRKLRLGFYVGAIFLVIDALVPLFLAHRVAGLRAEADEAVATRDAFSELLSAYKDAETGQRGFMITGREDFLKPYRDGRLAIQQLIPQLKTKLADEPQQAKRFADLLTLDQQEANYQERRIAQRNSTNWYDPSESERGKQLMDGLRDVIADLSDVERKRSEELLHHVKDLQHWSWISLIAISAFDLLFFGSVFFVAMRLMYAERKARNALTDLNNNLSGEIALRTETMERLQQQSDRLRQVVQIQRALAEAQLDIEKFRSEIAEHVLAIKPTTGAVIEMIDGEDMLYVTASGSLAQFVGLRLARRGSLSGLCVDKGSVMVSADTNTDPRVDQAACKKVGAATMIVAPLLRAGEPVGVLKVVSDKPHSFDETAVQMLQLMAGSLGAALGNQLQYQKNQSLLTERGITLTALKRELQRREEYEQKILLQRQRTESILESSHEAFISIDAQGRVCEWNALAAATFGWNKEEVLGHLLEEFIVPERMRDAHRRGIEHYLQTGEGPVLNRRLELPAICRDGREIPIEMTISTLRDGDKIEFPCFLRDITERKQAEAVLMNQQLTLRAMTNAIPALVSLIDGTERYRYCNDEYTKIFGVAADKIVGMSVREFVGDAVYNESKSHIDRALAGESVVYERTMPTIIGLRHQECRHIPQFNADGEPDGFYLIAWDITDRKTQEIEWQSRASIDELTGLLNRAFFTEALNLALPRHLRSGASIAVLYLDVDRFKHINDTYGHAAGDALLQAFANYLKQSVRQSDIVGRMGGDEFCIILADVKMPLNAVAVAEKILAAVRTPVQFENHTLQISTSIGIAFTPQPHLNSSQLIALADAALYKAKQAGRNCYKLDIVAPEQNTKALN